MKTLIKDQIRLVKNRIIASDGEEESLLRSALTELIAKQRDGVTAAQHLPERVQNMIERQHKLDVANDHQRKRDSGELDRRGTRKQQLEDARDSKKSEIQKVKVGPRTAETAVQYRRLLNDLKAIESELNEIDSVYDRERLEAETEPVNGRLSPSSEEMENLSVLQKEHADAMRYYRGNTHDRNGAVRVTRTRKSMEAYAAEIGAEI